MNLRGSLDSKNGGGIHATTFIVQQKKPSSLRADFDLTFTYLIFLRIQLQHQLREHKHKNDSFHKDRQPNH